MAKFSNSNNSLFLNVYVDQGAQNTAGNSTTVNWRLTVSRTGNYLTYNEQGDSTLSLSLDGRQVHSSNPRWRTSGNEVTLASGSSVIGHGGDGTKSLSVSATFNPANGIHGVITVSASISLTPIPRASSVSVGNGVIGSPMAITINRQSDSFTHTLRYAWGSKSGTIASNVGTGQSWTIPNDFANDIPNATTGQGVILVDTYSGGVKTGTQQVTFTASVPASMKPTLGGVTLTDTNTTARNLVTGNNFLQVVSDISVGFTGASGSYGSTITGYRAEIVNRNQVTTANGGRLGLMNFTGSAVIRAWVVDSRGRQSDAREVTINVLEYFAPVLSFTAVRTRESPNTIQVVRQARVAPILLSGSQKNSLTLSFRVAPLGSTNYTADNGSASGTFTTQHTLTNSAANLAGNYPANQSFTVIGTLADKFTRTEFTATVATESVVMSYDKNGRVGIGKVAELGTAGSLDVAGDIYARGKMIQHHQLSQNNGIAIPANGDWNNYRETGFYMGSGLSNQPPMGFGQHAWKFVKVIKHNDSWCVQEAVDFNGKAVWVRTFSNSSWTAWVAPGLNQFYPVGAIYQSTTATNPGTFMGGTWERFGQGRVLVGVSESEAEFSTAQKLGGAKTHTLTVAELPSHSHGQRVTANPNHGGSGIRQDWGGDGSGYLNYPQGVNTDPTGGGQAHNNLQPYITVYMWRRTA